jgi:predicted phage tail protein
VTVARRVIGALLVVTGATWFLQGIDVIKSSSFMTGTTTWTIIGAAVVVVGIAAIAAPKRRKP